MEDYKKKYEEALAKARKMYSEDLKEATVKYAIERERDPQYPIYNWQYEIEMAFKAGAQWQEEQFEKNRLAACKAQTIEEAEREQDFVMGIINNEKRQPTFSDAIEYGRQQIISRAVEYIREDWWKMMVYDVNDYGGSCFNLDKTIERFRQAMGMPERLA